MCPHSPSASATGTAGYGDDNGGHNEGAWTCDGDGGGYGSTATATVMARWQRVWLDGNGAGNGSATVLARRQRVRLEDFDGDTATAMMR